MIANHPIGIYPRCSCIFPWNFAGVALRLRLSSNTTSGQGSLLALSNRVISHRSNHEIYSNRIALFSYSLLLLRLTGTDF